MYMDPEKIRKVFEERVESEAALKEYERKYWQPNPSAIPRNRFGEKMINPKCLECKAHLEEDVVCDLCNMHFVVELLHEQESGSSWVDKMLHECPRTKVFLANILYAIIV